MHIITAEQLIARLKQEFPNELPSDPDITIGDIRESQGIQKVIEFSELLLENSD